MPPRGLLYSLVSVALVTHVVVTAFDNLPDTTISLGMRLPWLRKIPQWRFFAPNPGVEDLHVMYRTRSGGEWTRWEELSFRSRTRFYSMFWNPASRSSKALFDIAHQLRILTGYGSSFEWVIGSEGFLLMQDVVRHACRSAGCLGDFQFMILASLPELGPDGLRPILVSPPAQIDGSESKAKHEC